MKAIAEYFRDLAADDRYFGAEPPTPDPEMLAQLASRSAARRVEAHRSETGIVLRQDATLPSADADDALGDEDDAEEVVDQPEADAADNVVAEDDAAEDTLENVVAESDEDEVEAPVAEEPVAEEPAKDPVEEVAEEDVQVADAIAEVEADDEPEEIVEKAPKARTLQAKAISTSVAAPRAAPKARTITHTATRPSMPAARPSSDLSSVAAKLQRIRDVVTKNKEVEADFSEDQHADESASDTDDEVLSNLSDVDNTPMNIADQAVAQDVEDDQDDADDAMSQLGDQLNDAEDDVAVSDNWMSADEEYEGEDDIDLSAALAIANAPEDEQSDDEEDAVAEEDNRAEDSGDYEDEAEDDVAVEAFAEDEDDADAPAPVAEAPAKPVRPVARVLKVKRRDFEAAVDDGDLEEDDQPQTPARAYGDSTLTPEDEAELQNELKALENEIAGRPAVEAPQVEETYAEDEAQVEEDEPTAEDDIAEWEEDDLADDDEEETAAAPVNPRSRLMDRSEGDMDRILKETNNQLGDSDGTRRRSAIAHLRAAVAATKAEKQAGVEAEDDSHEKADAYRDDLAQVVRPRRPAPRGDAPARRAEDRPAPLKLVAAQRVDLPEPKSDGPVTPRRVRVADLAAREEQVSERDMDHDAEAHARASAANAASFTEFAERVGAYELPDILEAAASYLSFVEGREEFTRPQLMGKARQALMDEFSREDGLRHFGRLLREGKLRKIAAGQFTVSDRINFRPEERIAG